MERCPTSTALDRLLGVTNRLPVSFSSPLAMIYICFQLIVTGDEVTISLVQDQVSREATMVSYSFLLFT